MTAIPLSQIWTADTPNHSPREWPVTPLEDAVGGERLGPATFEIDQEALDRYAATMGTDHCFYVTVPAKVTSFLKGTPGVNARMMMELFRPPRKGDVLTLDAYVFAAFERRGKRYVTIQEEVTDETGMITERLRKTEVITRKDVAQKWNFLQQKTGAGSGEAGAGAPRPASSSQAASGAAKRADPAAGRSEATAELRADAADISIGQRIAEVPTEYTEEHILAYENVIPRKESIHSSVEEAERAGFSQRFASGTMLAAHVIERLLPDVFGSGWTAGGSFNIAFLRPILYGSKVNVTADVVAKLPRQENSLIVMQLGATDLATGESLMGGYASALARR